MRIAYARHGLGEHIGCYIGLIDVLREAGLVVYDNDHRGHGCTAPHGAGRVSRVTSHITSAAYWRWRVVHLWVEDFLELFTTVIVAYIFVLIVAATAAESKHAGVDRHHKELVLKDDYGC